MNSRPLGRSGLHIAPLVFGANVFGWTVDQAMAFRLLDRFVHAGLNAIDTADVYSRWVPGNKGGESEAMLGNWLKASPARRSQVVLITKVGAAPGPDGKGLSAKSIMAGVEGSLRRLQTDHIDLYLSHRPDANTPIEETLRAYQSLIQAKSARTSGVEKYLTDHGFNILKGLDAVAQAHGAKPAEVALAWLIAQDGVTAPIASATNIDQVDSLVCATQLTLSADEIQSLTIASG